MYTLKFGSKERLTKRETELNSITFPLLHFHLHKELCVFSDEERQQTDKV